MMPIFPFSGTPGSDAPRAMESCIVLILFPGSSILSSNSSGTSAVEARKSPTGVAFTMRDKCTQRAYLGHWTRFRSLSQEQGLDLPEGLEAALCDYLVRLAEDGRGGMGHLAT